ncbi:MAG TPA: Gfo/Idh/MocA family oxidoreductase [Planctomycetota bacterium]|nr:Gfo/Idh/MocA family oxidoreductase [Planctomycetota bacterium]
MSHLSRREFLGRSISAAAAAAAVPSLPSLASAASERRAGPGEMLRIAVCGVKGRGLEHIGQWSSMKDVQVAAIVDIDENVIHDAMSRVEKNGGSKPAYYKDFRKMLEDKSIDAVSVATCNHTHTLISISSVIAGKHVYVEKPLSHNIWEGRKLVEAARKYNKVVQHGTQNRSGGAQRKAAAFLAEGKLGPVKVSRGLCYKSRKCIGKKPDGPVPKGVDYNLWLGPAPERPYNPNFFHYNWHWHWETGNGDIGNQGVHEMDKARWFMGKSTLPLKVTSIGGRFGYEDDGETPNTQITVFDYGDSQLIFEVRGLDTEKYMGEAIGNVVHCKEGYVANYAAFDLGGKKISMDVKDDGRATNHFRNFIEAVKAGKPEMLNADVLEGHLSASLCHLANISYRLGELRPITKDEPFASEEGNETFIRTRKHLSDNGVDLGKTQVRVGRTLSFDPAKEKFVNDPEADKLLTREYRKPFVVPENP